MIAYHRVWASDLDAVLAEGLLRSKKMHPGGCTEGHICIAQTPALAPSMVGRNPTPIFVLEVDLTELEGVSEFVCLEARVHNDIPASRLRLCEQSVVPSREGWVDPTEMPGGNHPACLTLMRRAL